MVTRPKLNVHRTSNVWSICNSKFQWPNFYCPKKQPPEVFKRFLKNFAKFTGKHLCQSLKIETLAQAFSCEFCETFKDIFYMEHNRVNASVLCKYTQPYKYKLQTTDSFWLLLPPDPPRTRETIK